MRGTANTKGVKTMAKINRWTGKIHDDTIVRDIIERSGLKRAYIADYLGMSPSLLYQKAHGITMWQKWELEKLNQLLYLPMDELEKRMEDYIKERIGKNYENSKI